MKLEVREVSKRYAIPVLDGVSLQAEKGEFVCLLGPNGCGKTTLLRILGGLEPPTAGEVRFDGRPVAYGGASDLHVGVVFQEDRLLPWLTLADNVALVLRAAGAGPRPAETRPTGTSASSASGASRATARIGCPAACGSARPSLGRWRSSRTSC